MLGITIGIFCIVAIFTATYSLEQNIRSNIDKLGDKIVYVQKWPWAFGGNYQWWDYMNRPEADISEYKRFRNESNKEIVSQTAYLFQFGSNKLKSKTEELTDVTVMAVMGSFFEINQWEILAGRRFTELELNKGKNVAVVGYKVALYLFNGQNPIGKTFKFNGYNITIIGVLEEQGQSMGSQQYDDNIVIPGVFATRFAKPNTNGVSSSIVIKGQENAEMSLLEFEIKRVMRSTRKLRPKDEDNFAINKLTMFSDGLSQTFGVIDAVAGVIGFFSLLVGGFGIANIMFVSVKERTSIIGLQKALGARRKFIMSQFLFEAVFLCIIGALLGILIVIGLSFIVESFTDFKIFFSSKIIALGIGISIFIGLIAGIAPALLAARMDPVEAIRSK
ncbi:MAG: hypothetical protein RLZZ337_903 [Bacteroidota bacterium]